MKVKALRSFSGAETMSRGQEKDISDEYVLADLLKAGYVEAIEDGEPDQNEPEKGDESGQGNESGEEGQGEPDQNEPEKEEKPKKKGKKGSDAE